MINKILILFCALCISYGVQAHQPDVSSTFLVEQNDNKWVLQIRASLTAFEFEVEQHFGKDAYATPEEFRELVLQHLQEHIAIQYNDANAVVLENGKVKLGHETSVTFEVVGTPAAIQSLQVTNSSFSDISRNQSALMVLKKDFAKDRFILDNNNKHSVELVIDDSKFVLTTPSEQQTNYLPLLIIAGALLALLGLYFAFRNKRANEFTPVALQV